MRCFSFGEEVREGIEIMRGEHAPTIQSWLNAATQYKSIRLSREMREVIERVDQPGQLMLGRTHIEKKLDGIVLCRPFEKDDEDNRALVFVWTGAGAGGIVTWRCDRKVRILNEHGRYAVTETHCRSLELWAVMEAHTTLEIERSGELEGAPRCFRLRWDGTHLSTWRLGMLNGPPQAHVAAH
jgi:hypothetical protein